MAQIERLKCRECARTYDVAPVHVCEFCFGPLEADYDYEAIASEISRESIASGPRSIWRYVDLLPVGEDVPRVDLGAGYTPLVPAPRLGAELGISDLWLKNDTVNPTFSFKDRVVSVALTKAREFGFKVAACGSTGNLANAVAAHAAKVGMEACVFIPADLELGKIVSTAVYGARIVAIKGNYDEVNRLCAEVADAYQWAFVNTNVRAFYSEGSKTLAFEFVEQLGWAYPDHVVVPIGSGSQIVKVRKGLEELHTVGLMPDAPHTMVHGAQAVGCSPVAQAYRDGIDHVRPQKPDTIAKSIAIGNPADGLYALRAAKETGGRIDMVTDGEVIEAMLLLARTEGIFTETAGGVTVGVLAKLAAAGAFGPNERVVALITGMGLKTIEHVQNQARPTVTITPSLDEFEEKVELGLIPKGSR
ncbi:MAG TPA: threonine synthase [Actinomycetota bacterium]|nr:threonine synthase [Actinomycetota bacterium]